MKFTLIILTVLAPFFAHAGGGGGLRPGMSMLMSNQELISLVNTSHVLSKVDDFKEADVVVAGRYENNKWDMKKYYVPKKEIENIPALKDALNQTFHNQNWFWTENL